MSCLSCHSMHGSEPADQLKDGMRTSKACTQCHGEARYNGEVSTHTHHPPGSAGSDCLNCHMPHTTYALLKGIRSHQIESPRLESRARFGVPNACNLCHLDKTLAWTGEHLTRWYGRAEVELSEEQRTRSAAVLWLLKGHAAPRVIAAWHIGWDPALQASGNTWQAPLQSELLADEYPVVRYVAARSLRKLPGFSEFQYDFLAATNLLQASVREVQAAWKVGVGREGRRGAELSLGSEGKDLEDELKVVVAAKDRRSVTIKE